MLEDEAASHPDLRVGVDQADTLMILPLGEEPHLQMAVVEENHVAGNEEEAPGPCVQTDHWLLRGVLERNWRYPCYLSDVGVPLKMGAHLWGVEVLLGVPDPQSCQLHSRLPGVAAPFAQQASRSLVDQVD